ncbi:MAG: DUF106 domain-containing protein [Nanoarchaeota archaeon]|nr:DUF106 domain-containing protein [Nanoarchaeota archaeon]
MNNTINQTVADVSQTFMGISFPFTNSPTMDIFLMSLVASLFITLINKYMSDQVKIKALRAEMKELQKKMRSTMTKNPEKAKKIQQEIMKKNMENMKHAFNMKIMVITMLPMLLLFGFISKNYAQFGEFFNFFGLTTFGWLGTYLVFSIFCSIALKKILNVA